MQRTGKRLVIALGGNALGKTLPEQMAAVKLTAKAIADLVEEGHEIILSHGNGPQVGMLQIAQAHAEHMARLQGRMQEINQRIAAGSTN